jgi:Carboxypeptidase regulatory-like domain
MFKGPSAFREFCWCVLLGVFAVCSIPYGIHAQAVTGNISGTVADASGAVIAGATVTVTNTATGTSTTLTSNDQGRYNAPDLVVGPYEVSVSKSGFQTTVQKNINLTVGSQWVANLTLQVGQATQTVTVESAVSQVETQSTALSSLVSPTQMRDLPLNGRNFEQLLNLAPGVTPTPAGTTALYGIGQSYSIAGSRTEDTQYLLDNQNMADFWNHQAGSEVLGTSLGIEGMQEFSVLTNTYSSQFGGIAVVNAVSRSGTNVLHGSLYEFARNSALDSRSYFDLTPAGAPYKPDFTRNQFGASFGGPIKKNKLFFFANYEGLRQNLGQTAASVGVPEPYILGNGTIGQLPCGAPGTANDTFVNSDPSSTTACHNAAALQTGPLVSNPLYPSSGPPQVPSWGAVSGIATGTNPVEPAGTFGSGATGQTAAAGPAIAGILGLYNTAFTPPANAVDQGGYYYTTASATQTASENYGLGRIDYAFSPNDTLFGRYVIDQANDLLPLTGFFGSSLTYWPEVDNTKNQFATIQERHIFSANVVNNARFFFTRTYESSFSHSTLPEASDPLNFNPNRFPEDASVSPFGFNITSIGSNQFVSDILVVNTFGVGDDVAWTKGNHTITFGADVLRPQSNLYSPFEIGGDYPFASLQSFVYGVTGGSTGYAVANSPYTDNSSRYFREIDIDPYINDSWKVSSGLTVNLGLRYEYGTNPSGFPLYAVLNPPYGDGGFSPVSHVFQASPNRKNIDPRIGLAWTPFGDQKTVVRAGYGIFHDPVAARTYASAYYFSPPFNYHQFPSGTQGFPNAFVNPTNGMPLPAPLPPQDEPAACATNNVVNNSIGCTSLGDGVPYNTSVAPYMEQWNLNVQRELWQGTILTVGYVGSHGVHQFDQINVNPSLTSTSATGGCDGNTLAACATPTGTPCVPTVASGNLSTCVFGAFVGQAFALGAVEPIIPRVNDNYGPFNEAIPEGSSNYDSLQVSLVRQAARGVTMQVSYTYSHCLDYASGTFGLEEGATGLLDPYDPRYDYGDCNFDLRHNLVANVVYTLPFKGNRLVEGWQLSGIFTAQSGMPFSISDGFDQAGLFNNVASTRPDVTPGCDPYVKKRAIGPGVPYIEPQWINGSCFSLEPVGTLGNAGRNTLVGPRNINLDFALHKDTRINERFSTEFRAEFFNIANRTDFALPNASLYIPAALGLPGGADTGIPSATYGWMTATVPNSQREIQFALELIF